MDLRGMAGLQRNLRAIPGDVSREVTRHLVREAEEIITLAKDIVPVRDGILRATGHVQPPRVTLRSIQVTMGFGGPAVQYALIQHERTDFHHTVGQAKYLEQPFKARAAGIPGRMAQRIRAVVKARGARG